MKETIRDMKIAILLLMLLTAITGIIYPLLIVVLSQVFFPWQANGSLIKENDRIIGSVLIGQYFTDPKYLWGRVSATQPFPYNGASSTGSNLGPSNSNFLTELNNRVANIKKNELQIGTLVPVDLVTASGSGLDPDISPLAAFYQVKRIAKIRHMTEADVQALLQSHIRNRTFGILGEPSINVLQFNIAIDKAQRSYYERKTSKS